MTKILKIFPVFLLLIISGFIPNLSAQVSSPATPEELRQRVEQAFRAQDEEALRNLHYWGDEAKADYGYIFRTGEILSSAKEDGLVSVSLKPLPQDFQAEYVEYAGEQETKLRFNLIPLGLIEVETKSRLTPENSLRHSLVYGENEGVYLLANQVMEVAKSSGPPLQLTIKSDKPLYAVGDEITIDCELTNHSKAPQKVLTYSNMFNFPYSNPFSVQDPNSGEEAKFIGTFFQRRQPEEEDYIILKPGEAVNLSYRLDLHYAIKKSSVYLIKWSDWQRDMIGGVGLASNMIRIEVK